MKYQLIVNNLQVGSYKGLKDMIKSALVYGGGKKMKSMNWNGNKCFVWFYE